MNPFEEYVKTLESAHMEVEFFKFQKDHIDSDSYGVVECVHQIFLHGVV